jgi:FKBP-type peptidyl-prolyl cis-trans isomerase (trigger factor)
LENIKLTVPGILIDEEVNHRLSNLLARLEKLGLSLESYLSSIGKTTNTLREEYSNQAEKAIKIDLILTTIANKENVKVEDKDIEKALKGSKVSDSKGTKLTSPEQERLVRSMLTKQRVLDSLISTL